MHTCAQRIHMSRVFMASTSICTEGQRATSSLRQQGRTHSSSAVVSSSYLVMKVLKAELLSKVPWSLGRQHFGFPFQFQKEGSSYAKKTHEKNVVLGKDEVCVEGRVRGRRRGEEGEGHENKGGWVGQWVGGWVGGWVVVLTACFSSQRVCSRLATN